MKNSHIAILALAIGAALGVGVQTYLAGMNAEHNAMNSAASEGSKEPLYWVAPMDPNYKRDKPGKSPMG
ncbi:efflux transporter periplasmic adaptor subunit, partial [Vibrio parahaemolyticus]|nr:efflux transporter periplasmic adaptor subunit [Vibrio parahaemolyticus]